MPRDNHPRIGLPRAFRQGNFREQVANRISAGSFWHGPFRAYVGTAAQAAARRRYLDSLKRRDREEAAQAMAKDAEGARKVRLTRIRARSGALAGIG